MKFYERFFKYAPYISAGATLLGAGDKATGLAGWLSGEDYTGNNTYAPRMESGSFLTREGMSPISSDLQNMYKRKPVGAFGGFESTARDWVSSNTGYSWAGNLAGNTVNLIGEIMSAPIEFGLQARDVGRDIKGMLAGSVIEDIGKSYLKVQDAKRAAKEKQGGQGQQKERPKHKQISYGTPAQISALSAARKSQLREGRKLYGNVYDEEVAALMNYALHELEPTILQELEKVSARSHYDVGSQAIGRGRGVGV